MKNIKSFIIHCFGFFALIESFIFNKNPISEWLFDHTFLGKWFIEYNESN